MALNYSSKHDISYTSYNNKNIPWKLNASIISQNNQINNPSLNLGTINNNLVIESSQNDILFFTSQNENKKVIVKNNMAINNLDVSNNLTTNRPIVNDISLNNRFYFPSLPINIIGDLKVDGAITVIGSTSTGLTKSETKFINSILTNSKFTDVSIVDCNISDSSFSNVNIINSYIYNIPNGYGYDKSNNSYPNKAIFSDVSLDNLVLDSYINFDANASNSISIRSYDYDYDDYSKLVINKPLTVESGIRIGENISNVSIFYGTISCNTLYYSQLVPDIRLNTYFDISIGQVSVSGNNIPVNNSFNIGSTNSKFNEIISTNYDGNLSGSATSANDLVKNLDMSFNNLDIYGTITLNRQNLNQFLSSDLLSINAAIIDFSNANKSVRDLSASLYSKAGFDLCLNTNFTKNRLVELSFTQLNNNITSIIASVYSKTDFDLCLNINVLRNNDVSAIVAVVTNPTQIYPTLGYIDSSLNKVTNAKVTNELVFPYAITYIDDLVEDTNIRESLARIVSSQDGSIVVNATAIGVAYEINTNVQNWEWHRTNAISLGRSLAVILNAEQNERVRLVNVTANIGSTFIGALRTSKPNPPNLNNTSEYWQWTNGARWSYTNFFGGEPNNSGGEPYIEFYSNGLWNDINNTTRPAVYMNTLSIGNGLFKISDNSNNKSYYIKSSASALPSNISTSYSCIAITNDGMFVALGKASNVTVYMKNASGWTTLGAQISVDFTRYTDTCCNILWDTYDPAMYSNLQNLAINFNYNTGSTSSQLILAFGDSRTSIKVYSYSGGTWGLSNGIYSVIGGTWQTYQAGPITFTTPGTTIFTSTTSDIFEYLVVAGGGSGGVGVGGGGGGAGGVLSGIITLSAGSYTITVGAGGARAGAQGNNGGSSSIDTLVVTTGGGGGGGGSARNGSSGGSGGGGDAVGIGGTPSAGDGGTGITGQGFAGKSFPNGYLTGGGGGGAGGLGSDANGGVGISSTLTGTTKYYAGGGGAGSSQTGSQVTGVAAGGIYTVANGTYGGGNGSNIGGIPDNNFTDALANTGGGGGGNRGPGSSGAGGSGIVIIRKISLRAHNATTAEINNNNFGYFVTLSQSPSVLGFTVANKFYTYNCTNSDGSQRGSVQTLPSSNGSYTNIIAFKMSSDAEKIIVSNTYYVFVYKWNINNWSLLTTINLVSANITASIQVFRPTTTTGGTITTSGSYTIHSFKTSDTFTPSFTGTVQVLIVGGGGGGGANIGGGGGGGGVIYMPSVNVTAGTGYSIVVGAGGASETNGQNSTAFTAIAAGGGRGGKYHAGSGFSGGSGGGAGANDDIINTCGGTSGNSLGTNSGTIYGNRGGNMLVARTADPTRAAGGGGAGGQGLDTNSNIVGNTGQTGAGSGGVGLANDILGTSYYWAGGGGGGAWGQTSTQTGGYGGWGGGGGGAANSFGGTGGGFALNSGSSGGVNPSVSSSVGAVGGAGGPNTGGGGGGGNWSAGLGGKGGSGTVVIRYLTINTPTTGNLVTTTIPAGPRSLDISNISSDECVFAIGFPDVLIDISANRKARGYVEYWKFSNTILTRLATLVPRKRNIDSSNIDIDEYFFSGGGIKITNANTILVAPNFKFHFNNNNKNFELDTSNVNWATHNSNAKSISGREIASIENEADNELVKISARNNVVWIGAKRTALDVPRGITSAEWQWSDLSIWNYTSFASGQPNSFFEKRIQSASGSWYDTLDSDTLRAVYMTRLQYSLNTFSIFDKFYFHSSGFSSSYANTAISTTLIAKWRTTDTDTLNRSIDFKANGSIVSNGKGIFTISDIRLKENIVDSTPKLEDLLKVRVVNYNLKGCKDNKLIGVVAQELEQLFPTLVNDGELSMHDIYLGKTESYKSVKYSCFDVILIKAFQEHVAIINKLTSQLDEIECKTKLLKAINKDYFILKQELDLLKSENELFKLNINEILKLI